jgi:hypothetical protein
MNGFRMLLSNSTCGLAPLHLGILRPPTPYVCILTLGWVASNLNWFKVHLGAQLQRRKLTLTLQAMFATVHHLLGWSAGTRCLQWIQPVSTVFNLHRPTWCCAPREYRSILAIAMCVCVPVLRRLRVAQTSRNSEQAVGSGCVEGGGGARAGASTRPPLSST